MSCEYHEAKKHLQKVKQMDVTKHIIEDALKLKIISLFSSSARVNIDDIREKINAQEEELRIALEHLVSSDLLTRRGNYYNRTRKALTVATAAAGYEQAEKGLLGFGPDLPISGFILDVGCGPGYDLSILQKYSSNVFGIDLDPKSLYIAKSMSKINTIRADAHFLPFKNSTFDLIICYGVMWALDERRAISEASRVLKRHGSISLKVYHIGLPLSIIFRKNIEFRIRAGSVAMLPNTLIYWLTGKKIKFVNLIGAFQTEKRMRTILNENGIDVIKVDRTGKGFLGMPLFIHLTGRKR